MQLLFEHEHAGNTVEEIVRNSALFLQSIPEVRNYARELLTGTLHNREQIDRMISEQNPAWQLRRMHGVDRNILRIALFEIMEKQDLPVAVIIDEAVEIAKKYGSEDSSKFVNGVLDGIRKSHFKERAVYS